jgi:hypothetical protein
MAQKHVRVLSLSVDLPTRFSASKNKTLLIIRLPLAGWEATRTVLAKSTINVTCFTSGAFMLAARISPLPTDPSISLLIHLHQSCLHLPVAPGVKQYREKPTWIHLVQNRSCNKPVNGQLARRGLPDFLAAPLAG